MSPAEIEVPADAVAMRLYRIVRDDLIPCEAVRFCGGATAIDRVLRQAAVSGRVDGGDIQDHFADLLSEAGDILASVALNAGSYRALKTRWARTKIDKELYA